MKKSASLQELLCLIKDKRRKQGTRHSLPNILIIVIMGTMSGYYGYRGLEDFCFRYRESLCNVLGNPKHGIASYSAIRRLMGDIDFNILSGIFYRWVRSRVKIKKQEWMQVDGKSLKGTVSDYDSKYQNFVSLVSLFMDRTGIVLKGYKMENRKQSEITLVQQMIKELDLQGIVVSMDALHCKKNSRPDY